MPVGARRTTLAASHGKSAPVYRCRPRDVAAVVGVAAAVLHADQLPDALVELVVADADDVAGPSALSDSTAGSSWKRPDRNGEPPIRSPAATVIEFGAPVRSWRRASRRGTRRRRPSCRCGSSWAPSVSSVPDGGSRWPWKSLNERTWTSTGGGGGGGGTGAHPSGAHCPRSTKLSAPPVYLTLRLLPGCMAAERKPRPVGPPT